ncbi:MAG TPA: short-chain dehydrogenase/reductase [Dehalococcoidia bacterium]|nr:short-chain dehydrogenase/reductase [Dehalococcoidia bacterium]
MTRTVIKGAVVVTGASRGIGEACALHLDRLGFSVFAGVRREADGDALKQKACNGLTPILIDVTDTASIMSAVNIVGAGVGEAGLAGPLEFLPLARLREQFEVNVIGQVAVTQAFLPLLQKGKGRIVNLGSMEGRMAMPFLGPYCASKFAMEALTDSLRLELRPRGISVSIVEPGVVATPILEKSIAAAEEIVKNLPPQVHDLYDIAISAGHKVADELVKAAIPAADVARAVTHALTAKRPKTRYIVGRDARLVAMMVRFVPDRIRDWLMARQMGLLRRPQSS